MHVGVEATSKPTPQPILRVHVAGNRNAACIKSQRRRTLLDPNRPFFRSHRPAPPPRPTRPFVFVFVIVITVVVVILIVISIDTVQVR
jgi:hypothetical protein